MQDNEMIVTDRISEWQQRAAIYLLTAMGAEVKNNRAYRNIWYSLLGAQNIVNGGDVIRVFWPIKHNLRRYLSNHIWFRCIEHEIPLYKELLEP